MIMGQIAGCMTVLLITSAAFAGQSCEPREVTPAEIRSGSALEHKIKLQMGSQNAHATVLARVGRDLSEYGLRYCHVGLAVYDDANRRWIVLHLLNHCGTAESALYAQGLGNFFLDDLFRFEALVVVPSEQLQVKL